MTRGNKGFICKRLLRILLVILISSYFPIAQATDWDNCADDLDDLRRAADDASDAAKEVQSAKEELESKRDELENCINYPKVYDLMHDRCQSVRWDYESALSDYKSKLSYLESELNTVENRIRSVQLSCNYQFSIATGRPRPGVQGRDRCDSFRKYKGVLPTETLFELCKKYMTEDECKKCLDIK